MPEIDPLSERIGLLTASVDNLREAQNTVSAKLDILLANYASKHDLNEVEHRVAKLEHADTTGRATWRTIVSFGGVGSFVVGIIALLLSGAWHDIFGHSTGP